MEMKRYAVCLITGFLLGMAIYFIFNHTKHDSNKNNNAVPEMVFVDRVEHRREKGEIPLFGPPTDSDKINFIRNADINSFEHLDVAYMFDADVMSEGLLYALVAANKFNIAQGNFSVYRYLSKANIYHQPIVADEKTKKIAMYYLKRGAALNEPDAVEELEKLEAEK